MIGGISMQVKYSGKLLFAAFAIAAVTYIALIVLGQSDLSFQSNTSTTSDSDLLSQPALKVSTEIGTQEVVGAQSSPNISNQYDSFFGDPAEAAEVTNWYAERGKFISGEGESEYLSYNQDTLEKLALGGDIRAMQMLAKMYMDREHFEQYGFVAAKKQYWNAAVHGSTEALIVLATLERTLVYDLATDEAEKKAQALEVLAIYKAVELRGDLWSPSNQVPVFKEMNHISISEIEQATINQRAQQIYSDLQQQRKEVGLGDFDNSIPESVKKFSEKVKNQGK